MNISTRLLLLFLVVGVLPLALFSYFNLQGDEETLATEALGRMSSLADKKAIQVKSYLAERVHDVRLLARDPGMMRAIGILPREYAPVRSVTAAYAREDALAHQYFDRYVEGEGVFYDVFLITPQGEIVFTQKHESDFATNLLDGPWRDSQLAQAFRTALLTMGPVISAYEYYTPSNVPALFIAAPIMVDGKLKGVFAVQLGNELLYRVATDATGLGLSGEAAFAQMDRGEVLYTTPLRYRSEAAMKFRLNRQESQQLPMISALSGNAGEGVKPDYRGKPVVAAWRYLPELGWGMVVKIDADEVFASIYQQRNVILKTVLGLLLCTGFVAYFFGRQISIPLKGMVQIADEVAKGNLDKRVNESASGELGLLARAFNRMSENLQALYRTLENRIEQRTRELNAGNEQLQEEIIERTLIETNLLAANDTLNRNQALLNEAQRLGRIGSWELNLVSGELHWSDQIYRLFELDPVQFKPSYENFLNAIHPDDREKVNAAYTESLRNRQPYDVKHRLRMADGRIKWVHEHCNSEFDAVGKPLRSIGAVQDITAQKQAEEEIRNLAFYDSLTKLPNRRLLLDRFHVALSLSARSNHYGAVLFLDLDRFKTINDNLGHDLGDLLLVEVGRRIHACVREVDTVARLGGDEFVILVEEINVDAHETSLKIALIAEKIRSALTLPYLINGHEYHSSPSIGVCLYLGSEESAEDLLKHADMAMYHAKESGRNTVRFFDPLMQQSVEKRAALEVDLRHAVPLRQLSLHYQIQLDNEHRPLGAEALLRWVHPTRGMIAPAEFIPLAEESMLILEIGQWVLETACRQLKLWAQHERLRDLTIAVNVSAQQFSMPDFVGKVAEVLNKHRVKPALLKLELTESVVLDDVQGTVAIMHALKGLGVGLSMDDFGTGYSSLSYLKILPLDQLKIDQSFVRDITSDPNDAVLVQTIIDMARNFRMNVIAEGVETEAQLDFLRKHGCMAYQGYLFSKPVPIGEFEALLAGS